MDDASDPVHRAAYTAFYRPSVPRLVAFLRWQGAPAADAAGCVQATMIDAYQRWATLRDPYPWCRWAASRRYARRVAALPGDPDGDVEPTGRALAGDAELAAVEQRHAVLGALDRVPSRQRQVMAWTCDGATPTEIAAALRITPEAVHHALREARTTLRTQLDRAGGEPR